MCGVLSAHLSVHHMCTVFMEGRIVHILKLELRTIVSCHVGPVEEQPVPFPLRYISSPRRQEAEAAGVKVGGQPWLQ